MDYKKAIRAAIPSVKKIAFIARVQYAAGRTIYAYSAVFGEITVELGPSDIPEGFRRGDIITLKPGKSGRSLVVVDNLTLIEEAKEFETSIMLTRLATAQERTLATRWIAANKRQK